MSLLYFDADPGLQARQHPRCRRLCGLLLGLQLKPAARIVDAIDPIGFGRLVAALRAVGSGQRMHADLREEFLSDALLRVRPAAGAIVQGVARCGLGLRRGTPSLALGQSQTQAIKVSDGRKLFRSNGRALIWIPWIR